MLKIEDNSLKNLILGKRVSVGARAWPVDSNVVDSGGHYYFFHRGFLVTVKNGTAISSYVGSDCSDWVDGKNILLNTSKVTDINNFSEEDIVIEDIALSLSRQVRYNGHGFRVPTIAEHSIAVYQHVKEMVSDPQTLMAALLHDSAEAYVGDLVAPIKRHCVEFKKIEKRFENMVRKRFLIDSDEIDWALIKHSDLYVCCTESTRVQSQHYYPMSQTTAAELFMDKFREIKSRW